MTEYDVCIIGGGAASLAAAASFDKRIKACILEKNEIPGRKIMATGGGRCNITNAACKNKDLTLDFFESLGMICFSDDEGRYYPYSNHASDVVKILLDASGSADTGSTRDHHICGSRENRERKRLIFRHIQRHEKRQTLHDKSIKCAHSIRRQGCAAVRHDRRWVFPRKIPGAPHITRFSDTHRRGVRRYERCKRSAAKGRAGLYRNGELLHEESGEIQFTADGLSGICIFNLTPYIKSSGGESFAEALKQFEIRLDLAPDIPADKLAGRESSFGILTEKLAERVGPDKIKDWRLPVLAVKGWKNAQCTAGGVVTDEIDMNTMESKLVNGLYFAGEVTDMQGPCGGFNLQNAWETGIKAAKALNEWKKKQEKADR